jgi:hypothetical protein
VPRMLAEAQREDGMGHLGDGQKLALGCGYAQTGNPTVTCSCGQCHKPAMHGSCEEHGCQWPQGLSQMIAQRDKLLLEHSTVREWAETLDGEVTDLAYVLRRLMRSIEDHGCRGHHGDALRHAEHVLDSLAVHFSPPASP